MSLSVREKEERLIELIQDKPFLTDEELANYLGVSVYTIRLYRNKLGIPDQRERLKGIAKEKKEKLKSISMKDIIGELIDLNLGQDGISVLETKPYMSFEKSDIIQAQYIFAQANSLALALIDAPIALTGIARVRYKKRVHIGDKLVARARLARSKNNKYLVKVVTKVNSEEVFVGKFIIAALKDKER